MAGDYLLDTTIVIARWRRDADIEARLGSAASIAVSAITVGELVFGALRSSRVSQQIEQVHRFTLATRCVEVDVETAEHYAQIKDHLRAKGKPIPENDMWIAACAQQHGLRLATRDGHFTEIDGLDLEFW